MSQSSAKKQKWIVLSILFLFILGGGVYRLSSHKTETTSGSSNAIVGAATPPHSKPSSTSKAAAPAKTSSLLSTLTFGLLGRTNTGPSLGVGTPGTPDIPDTQTTSQAPAATPSNLAKAPAAPAAKEVMADTCVTVAYHHKPVASHTDEEACSHHKNLLTLNHKNINPSSVCVRVNGTPVHYLSVKGHSDELIIGSIAGPKAKVTVRYCMGKVSCPQLQDDCTVPKDEFMEAIGGTNGKENKDARLGQWDPNSPSDKEADVMAKLDGDVKRELETNDDLNGRSAKGDMFKDWITDNQTPACGTKQASN